MSFALAAAAGLVIAVCRGSLLSLAAPPLSLDGYRDEKLPEAPHEAAGLDAINENCFVCHGNYRTEELVVSHAKAKVGCARCHGESLPHQRDEDHRTPPEKMYGRDGVDAMCRACHETHDAPALKVLTRWRDRCPQKTDPRQIVCTDCHYNHRLVARTVAWDRNSRKPTPAGKAKTQTQGRE